jgi:Zn-dependent protease
MLVIGLVYSIAGAIDVGNLLLTLPGLILGLTVHEFSHAKMANRLGDPTPDHQGRLTLNPLAHIDPVGFICLIFAGFGWGKAVQVDPSYFRNPPRDNMLVALAGPISNLILAFVLFIIYPFVYYFFLPGNATLNGIMYTMVFLAAQINLCLFAFNLLPFPPLDGSKILSYFLKGKAREFIWNLERYSLFIIAILFLTGLPVRLITPVVSFLGEFMINISSKLAYLIMF